MAKVFPEAQFIYLYRDPRQTLASMMEGWEPGLFRSYQKLPGWNDERIWSFVLTPDWRELQHAPLQRIVASQWAAATQILLDSLEALPAERWVVARYDALKADPSAEVARLCEALAFDWDRTLGAELPLARHTVSKPSDEKWRARAEEIESVMPSLAAIAARAAKAAER